MITARWIWTHLSGATRRRVWASLMGRPSPRTSRTPRTPASSFASYSCSARDTTSVWNQSVNQSISPSVTTTTTLHPFNGLLSGVLTLLVGRQEGHPACKKTERWGAGMVICLERGADLHMAQLMPPPLTVSCFSKIQIGFAFLVAHLWPFRTCAI